MKIKSTFIDYSIADSQLLVPVGESAEGFSGFLRSNDTAAFIIKCLKNDTSKDDVVKDILGEYDVGETDAIQAVEYVVKILTDIGALE